MHLCRLYLPVLFSVTMYSLLLETSATQHEEKEHEKVKRHEAGMEGENSEESKDEKVQNATCPTCRKEDTADEEARLLRIEMFKQTLIKELHLNPNNLHTSESDGKTSSFDVPKLPPYLRLHKQQDVSVNDNFHAETGRTIIPGTYMGDECIKRHATGCATFDLKNKIKGDISGAELWLYMMEDDNDTAALTLDVYELNKTSGSPLRMKSLVSPRELFVKEGWLSMDMTVTVKHWLEEGIDNPFLTFNCTTCKTRSYKALYGIKSEYKPLLVIKPATKYLRRDSRSEHQCNPRYSCCKLSLEINFFEIGLTSIIAPETVNIGYCGGACTGYSPEHTTHTSFIRQARRYRLQIQGTPKPCCVPIGSLKPLTVLAIQNQDFVLTEVQNIIVNKCSCIQ